MKNSKLKFLNKRKKLRFLNKEIIVRDKTREKLETLDDLTSLKRRMFFRVLEKALKTHKDSPLTVKELKGLVGYFYEVSESSIPYSSGIDLVGTTKEEDHYMIASLKIKRDCSFIDKEIRVRSWADFYWFTNRYFPEYTPSP